MKTLLVINMLDNIGLWLVKRARFKVPVTHNDEYLNKPVNLKKKGLPPLKYYYSLL